MKKLSKLILASAFLTPLAGCVITDGGGDDDGNDGATDGADDGVATAGDDGADDGADDGVDDGADDGMDDTADTGTDDGMADGMDDGVDVAVCQHTCEADADCMVAGMDAGFTCGSNNNCIMTCGSDLACRVMSTGECTANADCKTDGESCIDHGDVDFCVAGENKAAPCDSFGATALEVTDVDGGTVTVCSFSPDSTCGEVNGDMLCTGPALTCDDLMCPDPLTCDDAEPSCQCAETSDCETAGLAGECINNFCIEACTGDTDCDGLMQTFDGGGFSCL